MAGILFRPAPSPRSQMFFNPYGALNFTRSLVRFCTRDDLWNEVAEWIEAAQVEQIPCK
jgi:hypothetical protein